jgi:ACS family tartrate transporter-like MFS transporter
MFLGEGVFTVLIGLTVWSVLTERPSEAKWLAREQIDWLEGELAKEKREVEQVGFGTILSSMTNPRVLVFTVIFAGIGMAGVGVNLFLPQILKNLGLTNAQAGMATSIPYLFGTAAIVGFGYWSDKTGDRFWMLTGTCACAALGMAIAGVIHDSIWVLAAFSLAVSGFYGMKSPFWPLPSTVLTGQALAAGLAFINSIGNFCGYLGPIVVGYTKDTTGSFEAGMYVLAASCLVSTLTALGCALWMKAPRAAALRPATG